MKIYFDCLPCILRQVLEAARMTDCDENMQKEIMNKAIDELKNFNLYSSSPEIARSMHEIVREVTGVEDVYKDIKQIDLNAALTLYPYVKDFVLKKEDKLYWGLKAAAVGNVLDSAIIKNPDIAKSIDDELEKPFSLCDINELKLKLNNAKSVLVIGDNCGETVFDTVLLEVISGDSNIIYAVRSEPIINDATEKDAYASGIDKFARIMPSGCCCPGTVLSQCSKEFIDIFENADVVIAKGQGNFETLSDSKREVFFLLKAKCPVIAELLGAELNSYILRQNTKLK